MPSAYLTSANSSMMDTGEHTHLPLNLHILALHCDTCMYIKPQWKACEVKKTSMYGIILLYVCYIAGFDLKMRGSKVVSNLP